VTFSPHVSCLVRLKDEQKSMSSGDCVFTVRMVPARGSPTQAGRVQLRLASEAGGVPGDGRGREVRGRREGSTNLQGCGEAGGGHSVVRHKTGGVR
jgi:hypothetical protein